MGCLFKYILRNLKPPQKKKRFQNPFEPSSRCRNECRLIKSLQCKLKPDTRVPKSDLSSETGASLAIYLCGKEKKKKYHKVALSQRSVWYAAAGPLSSETRRRLKAETSKVTSVHLHLPLRPPGGQMTPCSAWGAIGSFQWCPQITITLSIWGHYTLYLEKFYVMTGTRPSSEGFLSACQTRYRNFSLGISGEVFLSSSCGYSTCHACWL